MLLGCEGGCIAGIVVGISAVASGGAITITVIVYMRYKKKRKGMSMLYCTHIYVHSCIHTYGATQMQLHTCEYQAHEYQVCELIVCYTWVNCNDSRVTLCILMGSSLCVCLVLTWFTCKSHMQSAYTCKGPTHTSDHTHECHVLQLNYICSGLSNSS